MKAVGFKKRLGAYIIDMLFSIPIMFLSFKLYSNAIAYFIISTLGMTLTIFLHVYMVHKFGGSPGKLALNLKIIKDNGDPLKVKDALIRYSILLLLTLPQTIILLIVYSQNPNIRAESYILFTQTLSSYAPPLYSFLSSISGFWFIAELIVLIANKNNKAIHDFMAGTLVIENLESVPLTPPEN